MIILRIDDVGRRPADTPEIGTDNNLTYFAHFRKLAGLTGVPVYYGVVPAWINTEGIEWIREYLEGDEKIAIHGHDHRYNAKISIKQMQQSMGIFNATTYIPPFNYYTDNDLTNWYQAGGKYWLGGRDQEHHQHGEDPVIVNDVVHFSACWPLYGRANELLKTFKTVKLSPFAPKVMTLHVPWENDPRDVKLLIEAVAPYLTTIEKIKGLFGWP